MIAPTEAPPGSDSVLEPDIETPDQAREYERLWRGFMTARVALASLLVLLQGTIYALGASHDSSMIVLCAAYFAATLTVRLIVKPQQLGKTMDLQWLSTIGVDIVSFAALQVAQGSSINYTPLFALPVLMTSVLGSLLLAMGAAAGVTLLLFAHAAWVSFHLPGDVAPYFFQAALTGAGCFVISFLANQVATRLASEEQLARRSRLAARVQRLVNELVIESLTDGILVVDEDCTVRAANPSAHLLLDVPRTLRNRPFGLAAMIGWHDLIDLTKLSYSQKAPRQADITIHHAGRGPRRVRVRTQITATQAGGSESLCVMFLQDQREIEARMRTEKMASMGRMSAAVAHEIRNPLAAITQANALLDEDLFEPRHKQLTQMVQQNASRLEKIVADVLNLSDVQQRDAASAARPLVLNTAVAQICRDWQAQGKDEHRLRLSLPAPALEIGFDAEHLRRVLMNLLDNAQRYAGQQFGAIQVAVAGSASGHASLSVWSNGPAMDQSVERHLFEPFFSSESRSSGLGLYICRELCEGHGASIAYYRTERQVGGVAVAGNDFLVTFQTHRQTRANTPGARILAMP